MEKKDFFFKTFRYAKGEGWMNLKCKKIVLKLVLELIFRF